MAIVGLECKLFYGPAGSTASTEATNVKDVRLNLEKGSADVTTRGANGWRMNRATLKDASLEFEVEYKKADAFFTSLQAAYLGKDGIALLPGDDTGEGLDADWDVTAFGIDQALEEGVWVSCTAVPVSVGATPRIPTWKAGTEATTTSTMSTMSTPKGK